MKKVYKNCLKNMEVRWLILARNLLLVSVSLEDVTPTKHKNSPDESLKNE